MERETILIVGAGIAGLIAANTLGDDYNVVIIEATTSAGGRIKSYSHNDFPHIVEGGPEFVHGKLKHTLQLLKEAGINYVPVEGKMYSKEGNVLVEQKDMIPGWDNLLKKMKKASSDMTMDDFLQQYFGEEEYAALRAHTINYAEGFDLADTKKVSVEYLYNEWSHEEDINYRIPSGYAALIDFLVRQCEQKNCRFVFEAPVKQIDWENNSVTAYTAEEKKYNGNKIIITIPLDALQHAAATASINFTPPLDDRIAAANQIGFGTVVKIIVLFKEPVWPADTGFIFSEEIFPTWWTHLPDTTALLTGWGGGPKAAALSEETDEMIFEKAVSTLSNIFNCSAKDIQQNIIAHKIFNWQKNDFAKGAYSYAWPQTATAVKLLQTPVANTIFFCGEAIYNGDSPGTVEAAISSALHTAKQVKKAS